jgi:hypothetical protein
VIVISGVLLVVAVVFLIIGLFGPLGWVYASIGVSVLSFVFLLLGVRQRRTPGVPATGPAVVPTGPTASTAPATPVAASGDEDVTLVPTPVEEPVTVGGRASRDVAERDQDEDIEPVASPTARLRTPAAEAARSTTRRTAASAGAARKSATRSTAAAAAPLATKKATARKAAAKKAATTRSATTTPASPAAVRKTAAKKTVGTTAATKATPAKKTTATKTAATKTAAAKTAAAKTAAKKTAAKKTPARKTGRS